MISLPLLADEKVSGPTLVARLLDDQQSLTAVERFSEWHALGENGSRNGTTEAPRYHSLLPATPPGPGQQYAFEVDLDRCSGCKACVTACHTLNGLDEFETWRNVGLLVGGSRAAPVMQHVTAACHHCIEPACMIACPVNAYEKDSATGIVKHLDDQCFGCQYCTMACPYDVPKYHPAKGIVRKCDMCSTRLAVGEAPACVQACPYQAIAIRLVDQRQVAEDAEAAVFLPAAPDPQITLPTTTYKTTRPFPRNLLPADYYRVNPQHAHWPLVVMLVLTQLSVGAFAAGLLLARSLDDPLAGTLRPIHALNALGFGLLALAASTLHLGRPRYAFRAVLGLRHSWLSREIVAFGVFAGLASAYAALNFVGQHWSGSMVDHIAHSSYITWLEFSVTASGIFAVFCSTMIYVFTRRECWSFLRVALRFTLTSAVLGVAAVWLSILASTVSGTSVELAKVVDECGPALCRALVLLSLVKLASEAAIFRHLLFHRMTPLRRSAMLMTGDLSSVTLARFALGILGGVVMPALLANQGSDSGGAGQIQFVILTGVLFAACVAGELLERYMFFAACAAPQMPGGIR
jgi:formate dehydrogenase iron-sulfur subunit